MRIVNICVPVVLLSLAVSPVTAQQDLKTKSVSVFKNGQSFVIKEGSVPTKDNVFTLDKLPAALFGTFWFSAADAHISQVVSKEEVVNESFERKAGSFLELLYDNKGKKITINTSDNKTYTGVVEDFDLPEELNSAIKLKQKELETSYGVSFDDNYRLSQAASSFFTLRIGGGWVSIDPAAIKAIAFDEKPGMLTRSEIKVKKPVIKVHFDKGGTQKLNMMYLQNGISWVPTYLLELNSETEGNLKLQAEVTNGVEDFDRAEVNFVVGVPNFSYATRPATLVSFLQAMPVQEDRNYNSYAFSNSLLSTQVVRKDMNANDDAAQVSDGADASEDLYFYNVKNVTLEKGGRAHYPLFETKVKIRHKYECNLPASTDQNSYNNAEESYSFDTKYCNVFHSVEIKNDTKDPFTTGAVMIVQGGTQKPLAQSLITYTGKGMSSSVKLIQAPDIVVEEKEKIVSTKKNAITRNQYSYSLVTVQSEVTITNTKSKEIELTIGKTILGKCQSATIKYNSTSKINSGNINHTEYLDFDTNIQAGGTKKFTYTYDVYVNN